jgi:antitoxin (DNA-binding transcriptional repressor) of toxin-antitoxin stability system
MERAAAGAELVVTRHGKPRVRLTAADPARETATTKTAR